MILCCGEALIDMLPRVTDQGENAFAPHAGGSVFNTAIALGRLGVDVQMITGLSHDMFGDILRSGMTSANVDHSHCVTSERPTTLAFVKLVDGHATYAFNDENTAGRMITAADLPDVSATALFFGGISIVVEPCGAAYEELMLREAADKLIMIDPNIRPAFIKDEAAFRERLSRMMRVADIVKTSDEDLDWLTGSTDPSQLLHDTATKVVLLTRGADGVTVVTAHEQIDVPAQKAKVVDTVGAGDTFNAGFLASLDMQGALSKAELANADFGEAARFGACAAAVTVSRAGANPPWKDDL